MHLFYRSFIRTLIFGSLVIFTAVIISPLSFAQEKKKPGDVGGRQRGNNGSNHLGRRAALRNV